VLLNELVGQAVFGAGLAAVGGATASVAALGALVVNPALLGILQSCRQSFARLAALFFNVGLIALFAFFGAGRAAFAVTLNATTAVDPAQGLVGA
jgi:hypothetical protein